ncbi:MAG: flippase [Candidatus Korobacteraceae bacterium]
MVHQVTRLDMELATNLTSGRLLARNTVWNLAGQLLPMAVGLIALPPVVRAMGVARFGVLSLAWVVIGYFSLFDLGVGRALTKLVADKLAAQDLQAIPPLVWTSLWLLLLLGIAGGLITWTLAPWLVHQALKIPLGLQDETVRGFYLLALSIPVVTVTCGLRGVLEAQQRFRILNLIRVPMSVFSIAGPLLVLPFYSSLVPVISVLLAGRIAGFAAHVYACFYAMPLLGRNFGLKRCLILPIIKLGGWMTVSNVVSPLMSYLDRFLIGSLLSVTALAYYTAPFDMVTRVTVIPGAVAGVLFPAFAWSLIQDPQRTGLLLRRGLTYIFVAVFPILLGIVALAPEGLRLWLGGAFAQHATVALRWLTAGVFVNCFAQVPLALIQSGGRPDITAKLHLIELPLYLAALWGLTRSLGIEGTAIAWAGRVTLDAVLLFLLARRLLPASMTFLPKLAAAVTAGLMLMYLTTLPQSLASKALLLLAGLLLGGATAWLRGLDSDERAFLRQVRSRTFGLSERS